MASTRAMSSPVATASRPMAISRARPVKVQALFKSNPSTTVKEAPAKEERRKQSAVSSVIEALDFAAPRSKKDADLLYDAKANWKKGKSKLSPEEYAALARKIRGTAKDYWKDYVVEERVESTYYKPTQSTGTVPYLPVLVGVVLAMLATTVVVVAQTSS